MEIGNNQDLTNAGCRPPARQLVDSGLGGRRLYESPSVNKFKLEKIIQQGGSHADDGDGSLQN